VAVDGTRTGQHGRTASDRHPSVTCPGGDGDAGIDEWEEWLLDGQLEPVRARAGTWVDGPVEDHGSGIDDGIRMSRRAYTDLRARLMDAARSQLVAPGPTREPHDGRD
jgi:hypothetical protein